jgi:hypothetical protein
MRVSASLWFAAAALALLSRPASAGFPLTSESFADPCIVVCPAGDSVFTVYASRSGHWSGDPVWVDFCSCPGIRFAPLDGSEPYFKDPEGCVVVRSSPISGTLFEFPFKAGGVCGGANIAVSLFIPDNFIRTSVASPDQNGDLVVGAADEAILLSKLGTNDPTADLNCDGLANETDFAIFQGHLGHRWQGATPAARTTWGALKTIYR